MRGGEKGIPNTVDGRRGGLETTLEFTDQLYFGCRTGAGEGKTFWVKGGKLGMSFLTKGKKKTEKIAVFF